MKITISIILLALAGLTGLLAQSNTTGQISGQVTDSSGALVGAAKITLTSEAGLRREVETDSQGVFTVPLLAPGAYGITVSATGFKTEAISNIEVRITETTPLRVTLQVGGLPGESVTVSADAPIVQTSTPAQGRVIGERLISELPLATRNFTQLLSLSTGAATYLPDNTAVGRNSQNISVNGARVTNNNYMINGVDANSQGTNSAPSLSVPAPESLQEFKVQTSLYDASYGRSGGGSIQALTKSGTNEYHGQLYEYFRNASLNANNPFLKAAGVQRPQLNRNVFGATFGGPIVKDRTFFFGSYQGTREVNGASLINSVSSNVFIAKGLTNDRSQQTLLNTFHPTSAATGAASSINPAALALLNFKLPSGNYAIPTPDANGFYSGSTPSRYNEDQFNANIDHRFSDRNTLTGKLFYFNAPQTLTLPSFLGGGPNLPGWGNYQNNTGRIAVLQWTSVVTPRLVHELRAGYSFLRVDAFPQEPVTDASLGIARSNANTFPGLGQISVVGGFILGTSATIDVKATAPVATLIDQWAWTKGSQTIRAGFEFRQAENNYTLNFFTRGTTSFLSFNDFLLGNTFVDILGTGLGNRSLRARDYNFFVQDDWKVSRKLTLNLGLRYDLDLPPFDTRGRLATFDPGLYRPRNLSTAAGTPVGPPVGGFVQAANVIPAYASSDILKGSSNSLLKSNDPNNFAPRFGFAYSPLSSDRLAIRGGYGIYYSRTSFQYLTLGVAAPPTFVLGVNVGAPLTNPFPALPSIGSFPTVVPGNLSGTFFDRNIRTPYMQQWNLSTQYALAKDLLLETGYVGSRGINLFRQIAINQAPLATAQQPVINAVTGAIITTNTPANAQLRAPFQGVAQNNFAQNQSTAESVYHSLQASLTKRFSRGSQFLASYTWSKSIDNGSGQGGGAGSGGVLNPGAVGETTAILGNQFDNRANRGVSDFDRTHRFVFSGTYELPKPGSSALAKLALHNWQLGAIVTAMSGLPIDIIDSGGGTFYVGASGGLSRASWAPGATRETAMSNVPSGYYFNPAAFGRTVVLAGQPIPSSGGQALAGGTGADLGTVGRNVLRGPIQNNTDLSVFKRFPVTERRYLELRGEFFNTWNQTNLANPVSDLNAVAATGGALSATGQLVRPGNFGKIISTSNNPRLIQFGLRFIF